MLWGTSAPICVAFKETVLLPTLPAGFAAATGGFRTARATVPRHFSESTAKDSSSKNGCLAHTTAPTQVITGYIRHSTYIAPLRTPQHTLHRTTYTGESTQPLLCSILFLSLGWVWRGWRDAPLFGDCAVEVLSLRRLANFQACRRTFCGDRACRNALAVAPCELRGSCVSKCSRGGAV